MISKLNENQKHDRAVACLVLAMAYFCGEPLSSALEGLTSEFGMGSGVAPPLEITRRARAMTRSRPYGDLDGKTKNPESGIENL